MMSLSTDSELSKLRRAISEASFADESALMQSIVAGASTLATSEAEIFQQAKTLVINMRNQGGGKGVEAFLHEYGLETHEGVAVMCLAEALLRIPDSATADALIRGTFTDTDWQAHLGNSQSLFVNASSWGLMLTGKVVHLQSDNPFGILGNAVGRLGEPVIRESLKAAMRLIGNQFVLGENIGAALDASDRYLDANYFLSLDILGEGARTEAQAAAYERAYISAFDDIAKKTQALGAERFSLSVKLSALHPRLHLAKRERLHAELLPRLKRILLKAKAANIPVSIDAEEASRLDLNLELFTAMLDDGDLEGWNGLGYVVQAYQKRACMVIEYLALLAKKSSRIIPVRLVKGAYWDSEIKWAQMTGLPDYPVFTRKIHTDVSYLACAVKLFENIRHFYPQFATHNARTVASIAWLAKKYHAGRDAFEFQRLHGMGELLHDQLTKEYRCRIYAPVGLHRDLLAYLIRRLMENSANTSFVHLMMDVQAPIELLLADPIQKTKADKGTPNPDIPAPEFLYGARWKNSDGLDIAYLHMHDALKTRLGEFADITWKAAPLLAGPVSAHLKTRSVIAPANNNDIIGQIAEAEVSLIDAAALAAKDAQSDWDESGVEARAMMLEKIADVFEKNRTELMAILMREAGKTWADAIAEVREAADFCRYYAHEARKQFEPDMRLGPTGESNILTLHGRGVFACVSPWNFPLAIFTGQIVAALVTGNSVIAKPAEQTPLIAHRAVTLMHDAGVPKAVLQLLPGDGEIGAALVKHRAISGVIFTGSDAVAKSINQSLAVRSGAIIPLIAETGGINCMVVDSSALLEQACDDIITSAFGSAGQRCSALRLLYVQEEIADDLFALLEGALAELALGDTRFFETDIGPVIDSDAKRNLDAHIASLSKSARLIATVPAASIQAKNAHLVAPHIFELKSDSELTQEFFGPILHVVRFKQRELEGLPERINAKNYGLTFGIQSRIQDHIKHFSSRVKAGNIYVNRSMIGAVVGVQPFGGEGLSGTGPKAGGPHTLARFTVERHVSNNIAAIGGNITLLSQK